MIVHTLNCDPEQFDLVIAGEKRFEVRLGDRNYRVGDHLDLRRASVAEVRELHALSRVAMTVQFSTAQKQRMDQLAECPRAHCLITSKIALSGAVVPPVAHWWKPSDAMQHGVVVLGIELERPSREAAGSKHHREEGSK
jgi:hypothetical protein